MDSSNASTVLIRIPHWSPTTLACRLICPRLHLLYTTQQNKISRYSSSSSVQSSRSSRNKQMVVMVSAFKASGLSLQLLLFFCFLQETIRSSASVYTSECPLLLRWVVVHGKEDWEYIIYCIRCLDNSIFQGGGQT